MRVTKCAVCKHPYTKRAMGQKVCGVKCSLVYGRRHNERKAKAALKVRKEKLKTRADHAKTAQVAFNAFIRERDKDLPCLSCGRHHTGQYHAGHYRSTASQPALRFNELNCHKQCMPCNTHKSGNITEYRIRLIEKIGQSLVDWLEIDHTQPQKWTIDELKAITQYYRRALKEMQRG